MKKLTPEEWEKKLSKETEFFTGRKPGNLSEEQLKKQEWIPFENGTKQGDPCTILKIEMYR